jgi:1-phosphofructokinase
MIYTITLNPAIDKAVVIEDFTIDKVNRIKELQEDPGGKGINVSKMIKELEGNSTAVIVKGGQHGLKLEGMLEDMNLNYESIACAGETRINLKIVDKINNTFTDINEPGPVLNGEILEELEGYLESNLKDKDILVLAGSISRGAPVDIYKKWIQIANSMGAKVILDADREALIKGMEGIPFLIKPNQEELERYFKKTFEDDEDVAYYSKLLVDDGINFVIVSQGIKGCLLVSKEGVTKFDALKVKVKSTVGAGDAMVASIAHGVEKVLSSKEEVSHKEMESIVSYGVAASSASIEQPGTIMGSKDRVEELNAMVEAVELTNQPMRR